VLACLNSCRKGPYILAN